MSTQTNPATIQTKAAKAMKYTGSLTIATQVKDLDKSIAWYKSVLGFELLYKVDDLRWAELISPVSKVQLGLGEREQPNVTGSTPVWDVADINAARAALEAHNVKFDGDTQTIPDMVKLATFFDPDGNSYMLSQSLVQQ